MSADPFVPLASSVHAGRGAYALLLGSGVSRAAGIKTGWEITLELVAQLAGLRGAEMGDDPENWFLSEFGLAPNYSSVVEMLAPSADDRERLLEPFFVPSDDERELGLKVPSAAHHAVAQLVAEGFVRVVVTTNFDPLIEMAIREAGVNPLVIWSDDHAQGAMPLAHSDCTVIKVNGDYMSSYLKNTAAELDRYGPSMRRRLREVFDQFGLVVCGWSGTSDTALRSALLRAKGRRFSTYWMHRGTVAPLARDLIRHRDAIEVPITDSDTALQDLAQRVHAIADAAEQQPQDTRSAVALLKRLLPNPLHRIRVHDLVDGEAERAVDQTADFSTIEGHDIGAYQARIRRCEQACTRLMTLLTTGAYFSTDDEQDKIWFRTIQRISLRGVTKHVTDVLGELSHYPTLLAMHALAIGAAASDRIEPIALALGSIQVEFRGKPTPIGFVASPRMVLSDDALKVAFAELNQSPAAFAERVLEAVRPATNDLIRDDQRYQALFYEVEYLFGLASAAHAQPGTGPLALGADRIPPERDLPDRLVRHNEAVLIGTGLFRDAQELEECKASFDEKYRAAYYIWVPRAT